MKTHIIHHNDLDGSCAAAIAMKYVYERTKPTVGDNLCVRSVDYKDAFPLEDIAFDSGVILADMTPKFADFKALLEKIGVENVVWIDHHKGNINRIQGLPEVEGKRSDTHPAASMLAWQFYFGDKPVPEVVDWVNQWDTWTHEYNPNILDFVWGTKTRGMDNFPRHNFWPPLLEQSEKVMQLLIHDGGITRMFDWQEMAARITHHGFDVNVPRRGDEPLKGKALNCGLVNSFAFESCKNRGYDVWVSFYTDGKKFTVSLYKARDDLRIHLGDYAAMYGGGGHAGAAGFQCEKLPEWLQA